MKLELTPIEEAAQEYEREIVHESTQEAIGHVADVLGTVAMQLYHAHNKIGGSTRTTSPADRRIARELAAIVIDMIAEDPPFDAADIVAVKDEGERLLNQEFAVEKVRDAVGDVLKGLKYE